MLILISVGLYVGVIFLRHIETMFYSEDTMDMVRWSGYGAFFDWRAQSVLWHGLLLAYGVVCVGLIYFKSWARECFLLLAVVLIFSNLIYGVTVHTELSSIYAHILWMLDGIIIAVMYFSELKEEFNTTHNTGMQSDRSRAGD